MAACQRARRHFVDAAGGELILTTGIALPDSPHQLREYVDALARVEASGLLIETARKLAAVPEGLLHDQVTS